MSKYEYLIQVPRSLNYFWSFGGIPMFCPLGLIITGLTLGMHYKPKCQNAFDSVEHIMRDVNFGWLIRYMHMNPVIPFYCSLYSYI